MLSATACYGISVGMISIEAIPAHKDNLVAFLKCPIIPSDLRTALYMDISREARNGVLELIQDEGLAKEFLGNI